MNLLKLYSFLVFCCLAYYSYSQNTITVYGKITEELTNKPIESVVVKILNSNYGTATKANGMFYITIPAKKRISILFSHITFTKKVREITTEVHQDSVFVFISLMPANSIMDTISVFGTYKPDTLVGSPNFSIYDFDFYEDKYMLLTATKSLEKAELKLADVNGKILTTYIVPKEGGEAKEFYKDYMGFTNLVCKNMIYRINLYHDRFVLIPLDVDDVNSFIKPIIDTINGKLIFTDYWKDYPLFNYFIYNEKDSTKKVVHSVEDTELMHAYNFEYYSLKPSEKLEARRIAMDLKTDKHIIASLMSGFTHSMFYQPLYAPLYVINDTISVFDHYKDKLYHINKNGAKMDSVSISYNHPKNWKEWKHLMLKDDIENLVYAVYDKNGHKYLKQISTQTGKELGKYTLQFHSAVKLKIHDGYVYYIYRPFESTQQKFFYRELVRLEK